MNGNALFSTSLKSETLNQTMRRIIPDTQNMIIYRETMAVVSSRVKRRTGIALFYLMRLLTACGLGVYASLVYADDAVLTAPAPPLPEAATSTSTDGATVNDPTQRSLLHATGLLEDAGTFEEPKLLAVPPPAGLFGVFMIPKGKFIFNYLPVWAHFEGLQSGANTGFTPAQAAATVPAYNSSSKQKVRAVQSQGEANYQIFGGMLGITNYINLIVAPTYLTKNATYTTYLGAAGTVSLGNNTITSNGTGDTFVSLLVKLYEGYNQELMFSWGLSFPTGSITQNAQALAPNNKVINARLPYALQLGGGTYDAMPLLAYTGNKGDFTWGVMTTGRLPMESYNSQGWRFGNQFEGTGWLGYNFIPYLSGTLRFTGRTQDSIHGVDPQVSVLSIAGNPNNYGGQIVKGLIGFSGRIPISQIDGGARIALEAGMPIYQYLNGVQMPEKWSLQLSAAVLF
jgi:hypothetical protein